MSNDKHYDLNLPKSPTLKLSYPLTPISSDSQIKNLSLQHEIIESRFFRDS